MEDVMRAAKCDRVSCSQPLFALLLPAVVAAAIAAPAFAQAASPPIAVPSEERSDAMQSWEKVAGGRQHFEVASVRENRSGGDSNSNFTLDGNGDAYWVMDAETVTAPRGGLFRATNQTLLRYIIFAYKLNGTEELALRGAQYKFWTGLTLDVPSWVADTRYDIEAHAPGAATKDQMRLMMQSLLADRFHLIVHREKRQAPVFVLELDRPGTFGPQLRPHPASDTCATTVYPAAGAKNGGAMANPTLPIPCRMIARLPPRTPAWHKIGGRNVTLDMLAESLPTQTGLITFPKPVIDRTGLSGTFDFSLEWTQVTDSDVAAGPNGGEGPGPPIAQALKQQLGLKLQPSKGPVELLVIDHVQRPSEN